MGPFLKTALFTMVVPTSVAVLIPLLIAGDRAAEDGLARVFAFLLLAVGALLHLRSAWDFASFGRGTPAIIDAPQRLLTHCFYRYTRNPVYVAELSAVAGWAILYGAPVTREFGEEYVAYMRRVGRWLSRPGRWNPR